MDPFIKYSSIVIPVDRSNIDTDAIIPKQFLKSVEKSGFEIGRASCRERV